MSAVLWQRLEGALVFAGALLAAIVSGVVAEVGPWWVALLWFFAPDLGFFGYLGGPRVGAVVYNLLHLYAGGVLLAAWAVAVSAPPFWFGLGLLWIAHAGFDRMFGYGLKEPTAFTDTHLGPIGRQGRN